MLPKGPNRHKNQRRKLLCTVKSRIQDASCINFFCFLLRLVNEGVFYSRASCIKFSPFLMRLVFESVLYSRASSIRDITVSSKILIQKEVLCRVQTHKCEKSLLIKQKLFQIYSFIMFWNKRCQDKQIIIILA